MRANDEEEIKYEKKKETMQEKTEFFHVAYNKGLQRAKRYG